MELEKLTLAGEKLGYSGEALQNFVKKEREIARNESAEQRAYEKESQAMQLKIETMKKENAKGGKPESPPAETFKSAKTPNLPEFREGHDDMDSYLHHFELFAEANKWKKEGWALNLSNLLHGKGLNTYARLSPQEANNYDHLKQELLKTYQLTEDTFPTREKLKKAQGKYKMYYDRKDKAQRSYSVMEKECVAVVWAIRKLQLYLYGREFVLETDHQPLLCMKRSKVANGRIMRWALSLQPYQFRMEAIKGSDNIGADYMSRISDE